jgi:enamine deaminase RidA (YjgF/YER057c/UK114 family)
MAGREGRVAHLNPEGMHRNPAFTQAIAIDGNVRTVYVGGQNGVDADGRVVGAGDIGAQTAQAMANVERALAAAGAGLADMVRCAVYVVAGQPLEPGFRAYLRAWGERGAPPTVTVLVVPGLADPEYLVEIEAVAVVPLDAAGEPLRA